MKRKQTISLIVLLLIGGFQSLYAQGAAPLSGPAGPGQKGPKPPAPGVLRGPASGGLISLTNVSGTVQQLTGNDESVLTGFVLGTASSPLAVRFPARLGQQINSAVKTGSSVTISGFPETTPDGESIFHLTTLTAGKTTVTDTPTNTPATLPTPTPTTVKGNVAEVQLDRQGRAKGLLLTDETLIKLPPHAAAQLVSLVPKGSTISVEGYTRQAGDGQVMLKKRTIVQASQLTVNGQTFLVR